MTHILALADDNDLLMTVEAKDLRALLEVAREQMDCVDEEEAKGYGLTLDETTDLFHIAKALLGAIDTGEPATVPPAPDHGPLMAALHEANRAANGDSNDDEIEALNEALDQALALLDVVRPEDDEEED